jgi:hypothetical protein
VSQSLGPALPGDLRARLSQSDLGRLLGRALPLITLDAGGRPHPMLCSYLELLAVDRTTIRLVLGAGSQSGRNLEERRVATLLLVEPERVWYVKCRLIGVPLALGPLERFALAVEDVLEDRPAAAEGALRIASGITYAPPPALDDPRVEATLRALRSDEPR